MTAIRNVLASEGDAAAQILAHHLITLTDGIARLRHRQHAIATLLAHPAFRRRRRPRGKDAWVTLLRRSGFSDDDMDRRHAGFEAENSDSHDTFLNSLGLTPDEVNAIRQRAKASG
ncbi:hypothetical protein WJ58_03710 [Burkholderia ubonensis]|nr:hypothetical protein WJ58_03710 [Burkholderia ubonensis]